jgi:hypothetical protein
MDAAAEAVEAGAAEEEEAEEAAEAEEAEEVLCRDDDDDDDDDDEAEVLQKYNPSQSSLSCHTRPIAIRLKPTPVMFAQPSAMICARMIWTSTPCPPLWRSSEPQYLP